MSPKALTRKSGDVFPFHVYFRNLLRGVSRRCITPLELARNDGRYLYLVKLEKRRTHDLNGVFIELLRCLHYCRDAALLGQI